MTATHEEKAVGEVLKVVFCHRGLFLACAGLFAIGVFALAHLIPLSHTATAVFEHRTDVMVPQGGESFEMCKQTLQVELAGQKAFERVIDELGLLPADSDPEHAEQAAVNKELLAQSLMRNARVKWIVRSEQVDLIEVSFTHRDPSLAARVPNLLVRNYIDSISKKIVERLEQSRDFLSQQVAECEHRLSLLNQQTVDFNSRYGGTLANQPGALEEKITNLKVEISALRRDEAVTRQKAERCRQLAQSVASRKLSKELEGLKRRYDQAVTEQLMTARHPEVQALVANIRRVEQQMSDISSGSEANQLDATDPVESNFALQLAAAESEHDAMACELDRLQRRLAAYQTVAANCGPVLHEYAKVTSSLEETTTILVHWQERLRDTEMALQAEKSKRRTQLTTIQLAKRPLRPKFPKLGSIMALAIGGGLAFGYVLAFCATATNHTVTDPEQAAQLFDVPVCGVIGEIEHPGWKAIKTVRRRVFSLVTACVLLLVLALSGLSIYLRLEQPEEFHKLTGRFRHVLVGDAAAADTSTALRTDASAPGHSVSGAHNGD